MIKNNGGRPNYIVPLKDECDLSNLTKEQIKQLFEDIIPKYNSNMPDIPIIYGTGGELK